MSDVKNIVVFTDLDGSLLDHSDYSYAAAHSALDRLGRHNIPVIPVTSKTLAEIKGYDDLFEGVPKVGENGMVIALPEGYFGAAEFIVPGYSYVDIRAEVERLPEYLRSHFNGFSDMGLGGVIDATGLPEGRAVDACNRQASEPFLWLGSDDELRDFQSLLVPKGYKITQGGRFYHLMSDGGKDRALSLLVKKFQEEKRVSNVVSIALGDGPNDADMIGAADYGVIIPNDKGAAFEVLSPRGRVMQAPHAGPRGWNDSVHSLLDELGLSR